MKRRLFESKHRSIQPTRLSCRCIVYRSLTDRLQPCNCRSILTGFQRRKKINVGFQHGESGAQSNAKRCVGTSTITQFTLHENATKWFSLLLAGLGVRNEPGVDRRCPHRLSTPGSTPFDAKGKNQHLKAARFIGRKIDTNN